LKTNFCWTPSTVASVGTVFVFYGVKLVKLSDCKGIGIQDAKDAIAAFRRGELKPQPIEEIISELQATLIEDS
jgi:hypothetical protein